MSNETILIIEDDGILVAQLQDRLTGLGYTVLEPVDSGEAAIAAVKAQPPDMVLMDIKLAGEMDGITAAGRIQSAADIPIVYLTGYSQDLLLQQAKVTAPYGYLVKPVSERELAATLEMALYRHTLDRRLRESEEEIRRKAKELQEKNDELTRFTHAVSHDLRSPLVTIQTFQGHLERDLRSQDAARVEKDLGYIRNAADKMGRLLDEIRRLSRVGRIMNPSEEAPLQAIVKEALDLVAGRITGRGVRVDLTEEPVVLYGDRTRLVEVFMNLVDNAVKFMGDEQAPRVEIGMEQAGEELVLHVRDNGIGIDPQVQPLLFGMFHKLDPETEGEGIGLALVRRIVELHGGRIWVESEGLGKGTTFRFTLAKTKKQPRRGSE
jgi:signal transduction histidine kinase